MELTDTEQAARDEYRRARILEHLTDTGMLRESISEASDDFTSRLSDIVVDAFNINADKRPGSLSALFVDSAICEQIIAYITDYVDRFDMPKWDNDVSARRILEREERQNHYKEISA